MQLHFPTLMFFNVKVLYQSVKESKLSWRLIELLKSQIGQNILRSSAYIKHFDYLNIDSIDSMPFINNNNTEH